MVSRRNFISTLAAPLAARGESKPNILFILMDDMSARALSCYGNPYVQTANLDRLASQGMRFTQAYVTPQCTPTRATLLTGQYTARNRMWHVIPYYAAPWGRVEEPNYVESLPRGAFTLANGLKAAGYATACIGKWHLTTGPDGNYNTLRPAGAPHFGFDEGVESIAKEVMDYDRGVNFLTDRAIDFIRRNQGRPWFCYLSHHATHRVLAAPPELIARYRGKGFPETGLNSALVLASMEHMDTGIGRVLEHAGGNTAVVFLTDNGGIYRSYSQKPRRRSDGGWELTDPVYEFESTPLREGKGYAYEGGIRVPMIVRWPGHVPAGAVNDTPVHAVDLMPTFFDMAGASAPRGYPLDGVNLRPMLEGRGRPAERSLYWYMPLYDILWAGTPCAIVRRGDHKLIEYFGDSYDGPRHVIGNKLELYDLRRDVGETRNLAGDMPQLAEQMRADLHAWIQSCGSPVPGLNARFDQERALEQIKVRP
jgi:arylsulfatase A